MDGQDKGREEGMRREFLLHWSEMTSIQCFRQLGLAGSGISLEEKSLTQRRNEEQKGKTITVTVTVTD